MKDQGGLEVDWVTPLLEHKGTWGKGKASTVYCCTITILYNSRAKVAAILL